MKNWIKTIYHFTTVNIFVHFFLVFFSAHILKIGIIFYMHFGFHCSLRIVGAWRCSKPWSLGGKPNILFWKFPNIQQVWKKIFQLIHKYFPPRFYHYHFTRFPFSHIYPFVHPLSVNQSNLFFDAFCSEWQTSVHVSLSISASVPLTSEPYLFTVVFFGYKFYTKWNAAILICVSFYHLFFHLLFYQQHFAQNHVRPTN